MKIGVLLAVLFVVGIAGSYGIQSLVFEESNTTSWVSYASTLWENVKEGSWWNSLKGSWFNPLNYFQKEIPWLTPEEEERILASMKNISDRLDSILKSLDQFGEPLT